MGFLGAVGIVFEPAEPYKAFIVAAGTLSGVVLSLLISVAVSAESTMGFAIFWGATLGLLESAVVYLAKGGWASMDAPFVVPTGIVSGMILGPVVRRLRSRETSKANS